MFPEITRDEVFRIETPRLWLRWPVFADADALGTVAAQCGYEGGEKPLNAAAAIVRWRAEMEAGSALHLVLAPKDGTRLVGMVHARAGEAASCRLLPGSDTRALGSEAADAVQTMTRWLGVAPARARTVPMAHQRGFSLRAEFASWCAQG